MASFVDYPAPMGRINMDYISRYKAEEIDGVFGITLIGGNGSNKFVSYDDEASRDAFLEIVDTEFLLDVS